MFHKTEEKMHKKLKMALQRAKNLVPCHQKRMQRVNCYYGACGGFRSINSISFYCKLAAVLFCLSPNVANTDIVSYLEVILNKKKSKKIFFIWLEWRWSFLNQCHFLTNWARKMGLVLNWREMFLGWYPLNKFSWTLDLAWYSEGFVSILFKKSLSREKISDNSSNGLSRCINAL